MNRLFVYLSALRPYYAGGTPRVRFVPPDNRGGTKVHGLLHGLPGSLILFGLHAFVLSPMGACARSIACALGVPAHLYAFYRSLNGSINPRTTPVLAIAPFTPFSVRHGPCV